MQLFHRNSCSCDITPKHTLERIQTNATSATITQSHNPKHAHPQCSGEKPHKYTECKKLFSQAGKKLLWWQLIIVRVGRSLYVQNGEQASKFGCRVRIRICIMMANAYTGIGKSTNPRFRELEDKKLRFPACCRQENATIYPLILGTWGSWICRSLY